MSEEKYLRIAEMLAGGGPGLASRITKELRVSGRDIGRARRLVEDGFIAFDGEGKPFFARPVEEAERFLGSRGREGEGDAGGKERGNVGDGASSTAAGAVERVVQGEVASEARARTSQYLVVGKLTSRALRRYAQAKGIPVEEFVEMSGEDLGRTVVEAMDYVTRGKKIEEENRRLREENAFLNRQINPLGRLQIATEFLYRFLEFMAAAKVLGLNLRSSPVIGYYQQLLDGILVGEVPVEWFQGGKPLV
jgi:hypothetical protein